MSNNPIVMQLILTFFVGMAWWRVVARWQQRRLGSVLTAIWSIGTVGVLLVVWRPSLATWISELLGIGRGVDAILYLSIAFLFYIILRLYLRVEQQENLITKLVSEIALTRQEHEKK